MRSVRKLAVSKYSDFRDLAKNHPAWCVVGFFGALMTLQAVDFLVLGTDRAGAGFSEFILVIQNGLAIACALRAARRAQGITALFWLLFTMVQLVILIPTALQAYGTIFSRSLLPDSTWSLLYCLYGAPILMMLFLPDSFGRTPVKSEIFLDIFQVAIVVGLVYSTFFFLPARQMLPADALLHDVSLSDEQDLILMAAVLLRLQFARGSSTRNLLQRLALFILVCGLATFTGDWLVLHHHTSASVWFDLGWAIPNVAAALVAFTWVPSSEVPQEAQPANFLSLLGNNLFLVAMLSCVALLTNRWKQAQGETLTNIAIGASLVAFTVRLALTQFHQQQEIARRRVAQIQLRASNEKVSRLLENARRQTIEITYISELGNLLQACSSRKEIFQLIPDRLRRLFPGASGCISLLSTSNHRAESVAEWGLHQTDQIFSTDDCWALRRGRTHFHGAGVESPRCAHLAGEGASVCIPLIASGETIGTLSIQNDGVDAETDREDGREEFGRRGQLAAAVAEHIAVSVANISLRESLRLEAIRDPLTGLYNRRYMQEFLDREFHSARRKKRPLAVMMLDLDHFKRYNDSFGHAAGDQALKAVGKTLLRFVRADDVACRYGGEEFALILPECTSSQAEMRANDIRMRLRESQLSPDLDTGHALTVSIGVAAYDQTTDRVDLLLKLADDALYEAKHAGRDRVVVGRPASTVPYRDFFEAEQKREQSV